MYLRLYWSYGHCPLQPAKQDTLLTPRRHYLLPWPQLVPPLLHVLVVVLIQGLKLLGFVLNQEVTLLILNTDHKTEHPSSSWDCKSCGRTGLALARGRALSSRACLDMATKTSQGRAGVISSTSLTVLCSHFLRHAPCARAETVHRQLQEAEPQGTGTCSCWSSFVLLSHWACMSFICVSCFCCWCSRSAFCLFSSC